MPLWLVEICEWWEWAVRFEGKAHRRIQETLLESVGKIDGNTTDTDSPQRCCPFWHECQIFRCGCRIGHTVIPEVMNLPLLLPKQKFESRNLGYLASVWQLRGISGGKASWDVTTFHLRRRKLWCPIERQTRARFRERIWAKHFTTREKY